jgi:hypothetical protein
MDDSHGLAFLWARLKKRNLSHRAAVEDWTTGTIDSPHRSPIRRGIGKLSDVNRFLVCSGTEQAKARAKNRCVDDIPIKERSQRQRDFLN